MQKLRNIVLLFSFILLISGCSIKFSDSCKNIDLASIVYADKVEIIRRLGVSSRDSLIVDDPNNLKALSYKLLAIREDWEPIFGTAASGDYALMFSKDNKRTHRIFVTKQSFSNGSCFKIFHKTPHSSDLYSTISDLFNKQ